MLERRLRRILSHRGEAFAYGAFDAFLRGMADLYADQLVTLATLTPQEASRWRERIELSAWPAIQRLREGGKGVILASPHFGNLVLPLVALAKAGLPLTAMFIDAAPFRWARDYGFNVVSLGYGAAEFLAALARNEAVVVLTDLDFFPDRRAAEFFGAPVRPPHAPVRLALASGAPILPVYAVCQGGQHRLEADDPLWPSAQTSQETMEWDLLRSMETFIGRHPEHWLLFEDVWDLERRDGDNRRQFAKLEAYRRFRKTLEPGFRP